MGINIEFIALAQSLRSYIEVCLTFTSFPMSQCQVLKALNLTMYPERVFFSAVISHMIN